MADEYKFPMMLRTTMERAAVVLHNLADVRHRELDEDAQILMRRVLDDLDSACTEANLAARRAATSSPVADDGLPPLPKIGEMGETRVNRVLHLHYSAAQVRQAQREAYEAGRRKGWFDGAGDATELMAEAQQPAPDAHPDPDPVEELVDTLDLGVQPEQSESAAPKDQP